VLVAGLTGNYLGVGLRHLPSSLCIYCLTCFVQFISLDCGSTSTISHGSNIEVKHLFGQHFKSVQSHQDEESPG
jgi:hypothetical protein